VATQTDFQHLQGLTELVEDLKKQPSNNQSVTINALWSNAFVPGSPDEAQALAKLYRKGRLVAGAQALHIPVNAPFSRMVAAPEAGSARVSLDEQLKITVLSPRVQWLRPFADFWLDQWRKSAESRGADPQLIDLLKDYDILESFADPKIELIASPIQIVDPESARGREQSVVNLASIVLMLEVSGKSILLPADARSDVILSALAQAGFTDDQGNMEVDVLVVPHGGSDMNVSVDFFRRVKARHYIMSADGTHSNPEVSTFQMLFEARRGDLQEFSINLTYAPEEYQKGYPINELCEILAHERSVGTPFKIVIPKPDQSSFGIDLWSVTSFVDKGVESTVCSR
jgi:hypothetical protein